MYYEFRLDNEYILDTRSSVVSQYSGYQDKTQKDNLFPLDVVWSSDVPTIKCGVSKVEFFDSGTFNFGMPEDCIVYTRRAKEDCLESLAKMAKKVQLIQLSDDMIWFINQLGYIRRYPDGEVRVMFDTGMGHPITRIPAVLVEKHDLGLKNGMMHFENESKMWETLLLLNIDLFFLKSKPEYTLCTSGIGKWYVKGKVNNYYKNVFRILNNEMKWVGIYPEFDDKKKAEQFMNALIKNK